MNTMKTVLYYIRSTKMNVNFILAPTVSTAEFTEFCASKNLQFLINSTVFAMQIPQV